MLKAIETEYKGYRMRSRLEARWAVFFDTLGIKWEYEKEGYVLPGGTWYLPDFWLPEFKSFVEIKPEEPSLEEAKKCCELAKASEEKCWLIFGQPWAYKDEECDCCEFGIKWDYRFFDFDGSEFDPYFVPEIDPWEPGYSDSSDAPGKMVVNDVKDLERWVFAECRWCPSLGIIMPNREGQSFMQGYGSFCGCTDKHPYPHTQRIFDAYKAARQARFEHDERAQC